ncbi:spore germination protein GerW family protein [Flexithrix dorotheae]|uniref:spore germination protein GerW family protein n=1 Tax=Flexithrix dorotheae TaxID=70993 RepID=UPI000381CF59|nr:spore germination protein GerW family protein [Flexithrix dorotheae]
MNAAELIQSIVENLQKNSSVKTVFGEPFEIKGKTYIEVSSVAYGFGGGGGNTKFSDITEQTNGGRGEGLGLGGGITAHPIGMLEITEEETKFIPIENRKKIIKAFLLGIVGGIVLKKIL